MGGPPAISRPVGYEWLKSYRRGGVEGIAERSRRPQKSPRRTEGAEEQRVLELRRRYPDWGARKLRVLLQREGIELARNTRPPALNEALASTAGRWGNPKKEEIMEWTAQQFEEVSLNCEINS